MSFKCNGSDDVTGSAGLLIFILARYPEVTTINFEPDRRVLKFTFISSRSLQPGEISALENILLDSIEVFNLLEKRKIRVSTFSCQDIDRLNMIEVQRDIDSLVSEEIALFAQLIREFLGDNLLTESYETYFEDDLILQEEIIEHLLESLKGAKEEKYLFAYREDNRLLVFNK